MNILILNAYFIIYTIFKKIEGKIIFPQKLISLFFYFSSKIFLTLRVSLTKVSLETDE